jgi:hypothetical protein
MQLLLPPHTSHPWKELCDSLENLTMVLSHFLIKAFNHHFVWFNFLLNKIQSWNFWSILGCYTFSNTTKSNKSIRKIKYIWYNVLNMENKIQSLYNMREHMFLCENNTLSNWNSFVPMFPLRITNMGTDMLGMWEQ